MDAGRYQPNNRFVMIPFWFDNFLRRTLGFIALDDRNGYETGWNCDLASLNIPFSVRPYRIGRDSVKIQQLDACNNNSWQQRKALCPVGWDSGVPCWPSDNSIVVTGGTATCRTHTTLCSKSCWMCRRKVQLPTLPTAAPTTHPSSLSRMHRASVCNFTGALPYAPR